MEVEPGAAAVASAAVMAEMDRGGLAVAVASVKVSVASSSPCRQSRLHRTAAGMCSYYTTARTERRESTKEGARATAEVAEADPVADKRMEASAAPAARRASSTCDARPSSQVASTRPYELSSWPEIGRAHV